MVLQNVSTRFSPGPRVWVKTPGRLGPRKDHFASDSQNRTIAFFNMGIGRYGVGVLAKAVSSESSKPTGADAARLARGMGEPGAVRPRIRRDRTARTNSVGSASLTTVSPWPPILNKAIALTAEKYPLDDCPQNGTMWPAEKFNVDRNNRPHLSTRLLRSMRVAGCLHLRAEI